MRSLAPVNLRALINDVLGVHTGASDRKLYLENTAAHDLTAMFDTALIERVLHNLVGNAVRYCDDGGTIRVSARATDVTGVEIDVTNDGPLIDGEMRDRLFAKYAKGSNGRRGFGLYFCRLACEAHGGTIDYDCADGTSRFRLRIPGR